ncbi:MAG: RNA-binding S4 domain-containing protein [Vicinamibacterales bacterium]
MSAPSTPAASSVRLDVWLDVACLFKTRSEAKRACEGGKVEVNGEHAKPHRVIREGDRLRISRPFGRHQDVIVRIVLDTHVKKAEAKALYDDVSPKPTPEEIEMRRMERVYRAATQAAGTPDRNRRREIRKARGKT